MIDTYPLLEKIKFPSLRRQALKTLQINLGYLCNQQCLHCHVNASPQRKEIMDKTTINQLLDFIDRCNEDGSNLNLVDLTGGAPELNPHFKILVEEISKRKIAIMDRCNLTVLLEKGQEYLAEFLAEKNVQITASLPCYETDNVDKQRGKGVFETSIEALQKLNGLGYGVPGSDLILNLVFNPQGPSLPPEQSELERTYKQHLKDEWGVEFNHLFTLSNMPIKRFGSTLVSKNQFEDYMQLLQENYLEQNLQSVMCLDLISVDWLGYVYDCDFNQMLGMPVSDKSNKPNKTHISDLAPALLVEREIQVAGHCYGCTAGQGSSCGGALA